MPFSSSFFVKKSENLKNLILWPRDLKPRACSSCTGIAIDSILPFRWLSSGENRGSISQSVPRRSKIGLGTLLHCLAVLGPYVSADPSNKTLSTTLKCYIIFLVKNRFQYIVTFKDNIFTFRKNSRRKYFSFRNCNRGSRGGPAYLSEWFIFIYCWDILQKMGWFENKPHLLISMFW